MNISAPFVRRPIATSLLAAGLLILGAVAYLQLPVAPLPQTDLPFIFVSANEPGASPQTMAATVATPLERHLGTIAGVDEMTSNSSQGNTGIVLQFDPNRSVNGAARDVQAAINAAAPDLPAGLPTPPQYFKANPSDSPVIILALTSKTLPLQTVYHLADEVIGQRIRQIVGVSEVDVVGGAKPAVRIQADPSRLASMGLTLDDLRRAITGLTVNAPKGVVQRGDHQWIISADDQLRDVQAYRDAIVGSRGGVPIRLSAVAGVVAGQENDRQAAWFDNQRAILLLVRKQADANIIKTADAVKALLPSLRAALPAAVDLKVHADRTLTIRASVNEVQIALLISITLVMLVMLAFLRRGTPTAIAGVTVPLALAATFAAMWGLGFSLDNLSLMALTISVGFVVDDAIVVIENIVRHLERGEPPLAATLAGAREIGFTVLSMSLSLVAVFIPLLFMGGIVGNFFFEFSATLTIAIFASMVVALTVTPSLCGRFLRRPREPQAGRFARIAERAYQGTLSVYRRLLDKALAHRWIMLTVTLATFALTVALYIEVPKGLFPEQDTGLLIGFSQAGPDISFQRMSQKLRQAVAVVRSDPAVRDVVSYTGGGWQGGTNRGRMFISLKPQAERASIQTVISRLRPRLQALIGLETFLQPIQDFRIGGRIGNAQYIYALTGDNLRELYAWAPKLVAALKQQKEFRDVSSDLDKANPQVNIEVDRDAAARLGIQPAAVDAVLHDAFAQRQITTIYDPLTQRRVVLEVRPGDQLSPTDLDHVFLKSSSGRAVPLSAIARIGYGVAPLSVSHQGQFPVVNISYNLAKGVTLGQATPVIEHTLRSLHPPAGIRGGGAGNAQLFADFLGNEVLLVLGALLTIYIVLGILYESLVHPITILSTLPSAGIGALLALIICRSELDVVSIIGIVLLMGIVKKNAILMIDFALQAERSEGLTPAQAIYQACLIRFRPIVMTSMAALFGALPLAIGFGIGSELRAPLGIAVVGGLIVSQFLTLFTTPVIYLLFESAAQWRRNRRQARHQRRAQALAGGA